MRKTKASKLLLTLLFSTVFICLAILVGQTIIGTLFAKMVLYLIEALMTF